MKVRATHVHEIEDFEVEVPRADLLVGDHRVSCGRGGARLGRIDRVAQAELGVDGHEVFAAVEVDPVPAAAAERFGAVAADHRRVEAEVGREAVRVRLGVRGAAQLDRVVGQAAEVHELLDDLVEVVVVGVAVEPVGHLGDAPLVVVLADGERGEARVPVEVRRVDDEADCVVLEVVPARQDQLDRPGPAKTDAGDPEHPFGPVPVLFRRPLQSVKGRLGQVRPDVRHFRTSLSIDPLQLD